MDPETQTPHQKTSSPMPSVYYLTQLSLRVLVIAFTVSGAATLLTSYQAVTIFGILMDASYTYSSALRFKLVADIVVCGLSLLSVILVISLNRPKSDPKRYFHLLMLDLVALLVLLSGSSAALAIGYVAKFGQSKSGWLPICDRVGKFCDKVTVSIATSFVAVIILGLLTVMAALKLNKLSHPYSASNI